MENKEINKLEEIVLDIKYFINSNIGEILGNIEYHFSLLRDVPKDFDYNKELGVYYN